MSCKIVREWTKCPGTTRQPALRPTGLDHGVAAPPTARFLLALAQGRV
jgi:hypothetical protein